MPRIVLTDRGQEARVALGLLEAQAFVAPALVPVRTVALGPDGIEIAPPGAEPPAGIAVVGADRIDGATIRVQASPSFPTDGTVTIVLTVAGTPVQVGPMPTAGLAAQDVIKLAVEDDVVVVRVAVGDDELVELSALGELARSSAAIELGTARIDSTRRCAVTLLLDGSSSFRATGMDSIERLVDILVGVAAVVAAKDVEVIVSGVEIATAVERDLGAVGATALRALADAPRASGARLAAGVATRRRRARAHVWIVTDGVPTDIDAIEAALGDASLGLVVLADRSIGLGERAGRIPVVAVDPAALVASLHDDEQTVATIVAALLQGTPAANRQDEVKA